MNPKIAEARHRGPYLHELAITVHGQDNSQTQLTHKVVTIMKKNNNNTIFKTENKNMT